MKEFKMKAILSVQFVVTIFGTILAVALLVRALKEPSYLGY